MDDVAGWQQTRWGMTSSEIVEAVGARTIRRIPREHFKYTYVELIIPQVAVGRFDFDVLFEMAYSTDRLERVLVRYTGDPNHAPVEALKVASEVLEERFGVPTRNGTADAWLWHFPTTSIQLEATFVEGVTATVTVSYQLAAAAPPQRLSAF